MAPPAVPPPDRLRGTPAWRRRVAAPRTRHPGPAPAPAGRRSTTPAPPMPPSSFLELTAPGGPRPREALASNVARVRVPQVDPGTIPGLGHIAGVSPNRTSPCAFPDTHPPFRNRV